MEHTKEPWLLNRYGTVHVGDDSRPVVLTGFALNTGHPSPLAESNTRRIVACVNACAEISTATLEQVGLDVGNELVKLKQQRDDLLALVPQRTAGGFVAFGKYYAEQERVFAPPHDPMAKFKHKYLDQCEAAIAKVKEQK